MLSHVQAVLHQLGLKESFVFGRESRLGILGELVIA